MEVPMFQASIVMLIIPFLVLVWIIYLITSFVISHRRQAQAQEQMAQAQAEIAKNLTKRSV